MTTEAVPVDGSDFVRGKATVVVNASADRVRQSVLNYDEYAEFMPEFSHSKVLGRTRGGGHQVYMAWEILGGTMRLWARMEIPKATVSDDIETIESQFEEGNVDGFKAIWRLRPIDEQHTELTLELFFDPTFYVPAFVMNERNVEAARQGVLAMKQRIEQGR